MTRRRRGRYGVAPLNLLVLVASFAIAGAAVVGWFQRPRDVVTVLEWFAAAIVLHDLVALPLYSLLDRVAFGAGTARRAHPHRAGPRMMNPTPYVRIPAILSGLLLIVFLPVVFGLGAGTERSASGIPESGYLARWLLATGVIFAGAGGAYAVAMARARASAKPSPPPAPADPAPVCPPPTDPSPAGPPRAEPPPDLPAAESPGADSPPDPPATDSPGVDPPPSVQD